MQLLYMEALPTKIGISYGSRGQGFRSRKRTPESFFFVKIRAKSHKFGQNLLKPLKPSPSQNPWKAGQSLWKYRHKWCPTCFDLKKMVPNITWRAIFLEVFPQTVFKRKYSHNKRPKHFSGKFREIRQNSFAPPKICLLLHPCGSPMVCRSPLKLTAQKMSITCTLFRLKQIESMYGYWLISLREEDHAFFGSTLHFIQITWFSYVFANIRRVTKRVQLTGCSLDLVI